MLKLKDLRDYAIVFVNGKRVGTLDRRIAQDSMQIELPSGAVTLDIFVENMGRINFGPYLLQNKKGITEAVMLAGKELKNWKMYSMPFKTVPTFKAGGKVMADQPVVRRGSFTLSSTGDTYLDMRSFGKGVVWVNGHNLGKYWSVGPQQTLYVPVEWLKKGSNEIVVFELLKTDANDIKGLEKPVLNEIRK